MRILKTGDPCPCCGQPIKEGLPTETIMLLSWLQEGKDRQKIRAKTFQGVGKAMAEQ